MSERPIGRFLEQAASAQPDKPLLVFEERVYRYREVDALANRAATSFLALGVRRGDRVACLLPNCPEFLFLWFGLAKIGGVLLPINPRSREPEVAGLLAQAEPALLVAGAEQAAVARGAADRLAAPPPILPPEALLDAPASPPPDQGVGPDDLAVLIHTSGTTGAPKLVMQTHRTYVLVGEAFPWWLGLSEDDRLLTALPLFHLNAQAYSVLGTLGAGASLALLPRFSPESFWDQARRHRATQFNAIGAVLELLLRQPERPGDRGHAIRLCYTAPAPPRERHLEIERRFGFRLLCGYGLSESPFGMIWPLHGPPPYESLGRPRQHPTLGEINQARVVDDEGRDVALGEVGELLLRNPAVMAGYFRMPEETGRVLRDGWLHTGDLVRVDSSGLYFFVARKKEIIRRRGENLAPAEVEQALAMHPAVAEVAVVGVPSELSEEDVKAFVVPRPGARPGPEELRAWCAERLAPFKVPRYVEFMAELPHTPTGRVAKHLLPRERTPGEYDAEAASPRPGNRLP